MLNGPNVTIFSSSFKDEPIISSTFTNLTAK